MAGCTLCGSDADVRCAGRYAAPKAPTCYHPAICPLHKPAKPWRLPAEVCPILGPVLLSCCQSDGGRRSRRRDANFDGTIATSLVPRRPSSSLRARHRLLPATTSLPPSEPPASLKEPPAIRRESVWPRLECPWPPHGVGLSAGLRHLQTQDTDSMETRNLAVAMRRGDPTSPKACSGGERCKNSLFSLPSPIRGPLRRAAFGLWATLEIKLPRLL